jgi:hypothetical protein
MGHWTEKTEVVFNVSCFIPTLVLSTQLVIVTEACGVQKFQRETNS